ncbi:Biotin synthesis protein BioH [Pseudoalteromonas luteoviolacea B = ATCC 29581]|nr:Biotin synthesis protein BioH [Pseudoalteromonas luteoviolacea B = ATCC 29581]
MQQNIVFLHGWGMNKAVWQLVLEALSNDAALNPTALNLPGFGSHSWKYDAYELTEVSDVLAEQLPSKCVLVAWSMSGLMAMDLAKRYPEKVSKVILVGSTPHFVASKNWHGIKPEVLAQFMQALSNDPTKTVERFLAIQAMGSEHAKEDIKKLRGWLAQEPSASSVALAGGLKLLNECDLRICFQEITQPVLGIYGRLDSLVPVKVVDELSHLRPGFQTEIIAKASHAPFISHRDEFVSILKSML